MSSTHTEVVPGSFRDPSGIVFSAKNTLYRQINQVAKENYDTLKASGLYEELVDKGFLVSHEEINENFASDSSVYKVIKPQPIPFISYPYEWCFSQLKNAALLTLSVQKAALNKGMSLRDSSAYNVQFLNGKPIFIDTLSFEKYREGSVWIAYRQFCQHFLAPLSLMVYRDARLNRLIRIYIDGIPLDLTCRLLPFRTKLHFGLFSHLHMQNKSQSYFSNKNISVRKYKTSRFSLLALLDSLGSTVRGLTWQPKGTQWSDYSRDTNYSESAIKAKAKIVDEFLAMTNSQVCWDLGANAGDFTRLASKRGILTIAFDNDPAAVEKNYLRVLEKNESNLLPLFIDLTNPSASIGWASQERTSLIKRGPADTVLALALIHHLAISNNVPSHKLAEFFSQLCRYLIIEFVPKDDSQVKRLLLNREDIFPNYNATHFEKSFSTFFTIRKVQKISDSLRILYLMEKHANGA